MSAAASSGVRLAEIIAALSRATDLAMGQPMEFALTSCVVAVRLADEMGFDEAGLREVYYQALLRYIGCNADTQTLAAIVGDELVMRQQFAELDTADRGAIMRLVVRQIRGANADASLLGVTREIVRGLTTMPRFISEFYAGHCEVAERLATRLGFDERIVLALGQLYERWDGKGLPRGLKGEAVAPAVRVVTLAQDMVIHHRLGGIDAAVAICRERRGGAYDPRLADRFCEQSALLFADLDADPNWDAVLALEPGAKIVLTESDLDAACSAIADFADLKSTYTLGHSHGVAELAAGATARLGLPGSDATTVRRAGLIHDVGRVAVSAGIWTKAEPLSDREWEQVRMHPYHTERIFTRPPALARIAAIASYHQERLDGSGFHRGVSAAALSPASRVLAAADAYQAMLEPRPHRPAREPTAAAAELRREAVVGRFDAQSVDAVLTTAGQNVRPHQRQFVADLTEREIEVLRLLARGLTKKQIATDLFISPKTADNHVQHIYEKIGVSTRAGATLFAVEHQLLWGSEKDI